MDWKLDLYTKVAPFIAPHAIVASNTSGLSITKLSEVLPEEIKPRFCGIHFFNPPRYMRLVELIPTPTTQPQILDQLETFVTTALGKGVVRAQGHAQLHRQPRRHRRHAGDDAARPRSSASSYDVVDDLTGKKLGRASSGTFRTADVVGLDTMAHVIKTLQDNLAGRSVLRRATRRRPCVGRLIEQGALGQKTGAGFYKKVGKDIQRLDPASGDYVAGGAKADEIVARILKKPPAERLKLLRESTNPQAQFLWAILRDSFHYAAVHLADIADSARDIDFAMRWGFGSNAGPVRAVAGRPAGSRSRSGSRKTSTPARRCRSAPLPAWVFDGRSRQRRRAHGPKARGAPRSARFVPPSHACRSTSASRSARPCSAPAPPTPLKSGTEVFRNDEVRVWTLDGEVLIASITAKLHLISPTRHRRPAEGRRDRRAEVQGPGDLVARRRCSRPAPTSRR